MNIHGIYATKAGSYKHNIVSVQDRIPHADPSTDPVSIIRVRMRCGLASHTRGIISGLFIPHCSFTITMIMTVLYLHYVRKHTLSELSLQWHVSKKTIRKWKKLYTLHSEEWIHTLNDVKKDCDDDVSLQDQARLSGCSICYYIGLPLVYAGILPPLPEPLHPPWVKP